MLKYKVGDLVSVRWTENYINGHGERHKRYGTSIGTVVGLFDDVNAPRGFDNHPYTYRVMYDGGLFECYWREEDLTDVAIEDNKVIYG